MNQISGRGVSAPFSNVPTLRPSHVGSDTAVQDRVALRRACSSCARQGGAVLSRGVLALARTRRVVQQAVRLGFAALVVMVFFAAVGFAPLLLAGVLIVALLIVSARRTPRSPVPDRVTRPD